MDTNTRNLLNDDADYQSPELIARMGEAERKFSNLLFMYEHQPSVIYQCLPDGYDWDLFKLDLFAFGVTINSTTFDQTLPEIEKWLDRVYPVER